MRTIDSVLKNVFEYLKNSNELRILTDIGIRQPLNNQVTKGYIVVSGIENSLSGMYDCNDEMKGFKIGITIYQPNTNELSKAYQVNGLVYNLMKKYSESKTQIINHRNIKQSMPRWNDAVMMWMSVLIYIFYFDEMG